MPADNQPGTGADDLKAKFKEALAKKHGNDSGVDEGRTPKSKVHDTHGPEGGKRGYIRRKTG